MQRIVGTDRRHTWLAQRADRLTGGGEDLHLMRVSPVGDQEVALRIDGDVARIVESFRDDRLGPACERGEANELLTAEREQSPLSVEADAARIGKPGCGEAIVPCLTSTTSSSFCRTSEQTSIPSWAAIPPSTELSSPPSNPSSRVSRSRPLARIIAELLLEDRLIGERTRLRGDRSSPSQMEPT